MSQDDPYAERLYEWERGFVEPLVRPELLSAAEIEDLIRRSCAVLDIPMPTVSFHPLQLPCFAHPARNHVEIGDWGRNRTTVLHEVAHLGSWRRTPARENPHGRTFLTVAIGLYARFLSIPLETLESSARLCRLDFIPQKVVAAITQSAATYDPDIADF